MLPCRTFGLSDHLTLIARAGVREMYMPSVRSFKRETRDQVKQPVSAGTEQKQRKFQLKINHDKLLDHDIMVKKLLIFIWEELQSFFELLFSRLQTTFQL